MAIKALALLSGGLDSTLAAAIIKQMGVEVLGVHMVHVFLRTGRPGKTVLHAVQMARQIGIPIRLVFNSPQVLDVPKHPRYGYGKNFNPCIDCRILTLRMAKELLQGEGAQFVVTGEVLGQRPMSQQRNAMVSVVRQAGLEGLVLRPLSAKLLAPTIPELQGWVDRKKLLDIKGRGRKPQMELAQKLGIRHYCQPAGGCLLTDPGFGARMKDLFDHGNYDLRDVHMAKLGRHFRLDEGTKLVLGRNERENEKIATFARVADLILEPKTVAGPTGAISGRSRMQMLDLSASILGYFTKARQEAQIAVLWREKKGKLSGARSVVPATAEQAGALMVE